MPKSELPSTLQEIIYSIPFADNYENLSNRDIDYCVVYNSDIETQFQQYLHDIPSSLDIVEYWNNFEGPELSRLALMCISTLVSSVSAERSFSVYSSVLKTRPNATRKLLTTLTMLKYNKQ